MNRQKFRTNSTVLSITRTHLRLDSRTQFRIFFTKAGKKDDRFIMNT